MFLRRTVLGAGLATSVALATVGLGATVVSAAPASAPVADTTQTISFHARPNGTYKNQAQIVFARKTFSVPKFGDSGPFTDKRGKLTFTVSSDSSNGDSGCVFTATYDSAKVRYGGTYTCPDGFSDDFVVSATPKD